MTIKKNLSKSEPAEIPQMPTGGATIADRFKLDMPDPNAAKTSGGPGATAAAVAGLLALAVSGALIFMLYQHWQFLQGV